MKLEPNFDFAQMNIDDIMADVATVEARFNEATESKGLFLVRPANTWLDIAKKRPIPKMLFSEFWFEGELCILFADTNLGKSILGVQIGDSISNGKAISGFKLEAEPQKVLYFDFELSDKQFEVRYSTNFENHYDFNSNFLRAEMDSDAELSEAYKTLEEFTDASMEQAIRETGAKIIIIDNITYMSRETEKAKDALPLMKHLKSLKNKYGLSILALAHTPKRDFSKQITQNDLQGSKMLINFCDSAFSIGASFSDKNLRYLKQIKQRNTEKIYDTDNVCICQIDKPVNFLLFEFLDFGAESEHLRNRDEEEKESVKDKIIAMHQQGKSFRDIGVEVKMSHMTVKRMITALGTAPF